MLKSTTDWAPIGSVAAAQAGQAEEDKNCSRLPGEKKTLRTSADIAGLAPAWVGSTAA